MTLSLMALITDCCCAECHLGCVVYAECHKHTDFAECR